MQSAQGLPPHLQGEDHGQRLGREVQDGSDDEVDFSPVNHYHFFDIVDHVWQLLPVYLVYAFVIAAWFEVPM